ncbi:MAG: hypothetical protein UH734_00845 [Ruminococcus sp.]|nr:hypothetical protein [Ruminococcus sp.]
MIDSFFGAFIFIKHTIAKKAVFGQSFLLLLSAPLESFSKVERLINGASDLALFSVYAIAPLESFSKGERHINGASDLALFSVYAIAPLESFSKGERHINGASDLAGTVNNYVTIHFGNENALQTYNYLL